MRKIAVIFAMLALVSCNNNKSGDRVVAPWGETTADSVYGDNSFDLDLILQSGEMIMLTMSGPDTYYDYKGRQLGMHYLLCAQFANSLGVRLRVELCNDSAEMVSRLKDGDGDIIAYPMRHTTGIDSIGDYMQLKPQQYGWIVGYDKEALAERLRKWYKPNMVENAYKEEKNLLSHQTVRRHVFAPMLDSKAGKISQYDHLFAKYSRQIRWDWKLMAAQCYQESTFDPEAVSWAGAKGLMQIMPATADMLGLSRDKMHDPESNIAAATRFLSMLEAKYRDIPNRYERINFCLAAYNAGYNHIADARALARKHGYDDKVWNNVQPYVLNLSRPEYYRDPVVKYGYMRGSETVGYVNSMRQRWSQYTGKRLPHPISPVNINEPNQVNTVSSPMIPHKAKNVKKKYQLEAPE